MKIVDLFENATNNIPNFDRMRSFVLQKWKERARERGLPEPKDLSNSCKFCTLFVKALHGGEIRGNYHHQFNVINGEIVDLSFDSEDVSKLDDPYEHDEIFWLNPEHKESMKSCKPRVRQWVKEYQSTLFENTSPITEDDLIEAMLVATAYFEDAYGVSPEEINDGYCHDWYDEVVSYLEVSFDKRVVDSSVHFMTDSKYDGETLTAHAWIMFEGKHYDAEVPYGVSNHMELPIFKKLKQTVQENRRLSHTRRD